MKKEVSEKIEKQVNALFDDLDNIANNLIWWNIATNITTEKLLYILEIKINEKKERIN
ncbi:hypothetical protein [Campylobacter geochelonis]|uniref:Uncharacterized protein n=1 Tax=Campylobacter geochelonis TaxID=1780362 RepID=A0A128EJA5_9BACT|nr:hypothetical protein [Campylobacter geochelonis]QKF72003.1 hypothetical protein CGEO_1732 [Campylobacter geochelonis]CZE47710.1 Uncharacterised protein [Campylobacter geochelonis]CZE48934.1 Uncharacterised protein [Campylobacter geochelonis]CZE49911.1 Uncharacterised protein [Campylobacter geochelonis]